MTWEIYFTSLSIHLIYLKIFLVHVYPIYSILMKMGLFIFSFLSPLNLSWTLKRLANLKYFIFERFKMFHIHSISHEIKMFQYVCSVEKHRVKKYYTVHRGFPSLVAQRLKHLPPMWETRVQSLGREDPLEKEVATHSSIPAWRIPWMEEPGGLQSTGPQRVGHDWATSLFIQFIRWLIIKLCQDYISHSWFNSLVLLGRFDC